MRPLVVVLLLATLGSRAFARTAPPPCLAGCFAIHGRGPLVGGQRLARIVLDDEGAGLQDRNGDSVPACPSHALFSGPSERRVEVVWDRGCTDESPVTQLRARLSRGCTTLRGRLRAENRRWQRFATRRTACADGEPMPPTGKACDGLGAQVDPAFGRCGHLLTTINSEDEPVPLALLVQNDGRILVTIKRSETDELAFGLLRFTATGELDQSFGMGGQAFGSVPGTGELTALTTVQPDGRPVAVGGPTLADFALVFRFGLDGLPDPTFGIAGIAVIDVAGPPVGVGVLAGGEIAIMDAGFG